MAETYDDSKISDPINTQKQFNENLDNSTKLKANSIIEGAKSHGIDKINESKKTNGEGTKQSNENSSTEDINDNHRDSPLADKDSDNKNINNINHSSEKNDLGEEKTDINSVENEVPNNQSEEKSDTTSMENEVSNNQGEEKIDSKSLKLFNSQGENEVDESSNMENSEISKDVAESNDYTENSQVSNDVKESSEKADESKISNYIQIMENSNKKLCDSLEKNEKSTTRNICNNISTDKDGLKDHNVLDEISKNIDIDLPSDEELSKSAEDSETDVTNSKELSNDKCEDFSKNEKANKEESSKSSKEEESKISEESSKNYVEKSSEDQVRDKETSDRNKEKKMEKNNLVEKMDFDEQSKKDKIDDSKKSGDLQKEIEEKSEEIKVDSVKSSVSINIEESIVKDISDKSDEEKENNEKKLEDNEDENSNDDSASDKGNKKIKLRSFESLCDTDQQNDKSKLLGVSFGDILQHGSIVESDDSGGVHLKISSVVGGEDSITGLVVGEENRPSGLQISSVTSIDESDKYAVNDSNVQTIGEKISESTIDKSVSNKEQVLVSILGCDSQIKKKCMACLKVNPTKYKIKYSPPKDHALDAYLCSANCKDKYASILPEHHILAKPNQLYERYCIMCNKEICMQKNDSVLCWQTKDFCNKICLAEHIGNVARNCYNCGTSVRVLYLVKYCVRFGADVYQFCSNKCLEVYKRKIDVCCYCQINLATVQKKVVSASNKSYCSLKCQNRAQRKDIGQINYKELNKCTVCQNSTVNQFKFITKNSEVWLCSDPCLSVYKYANHVKAVNCCLCARFVDAEDYHSYFYNQNELRVFCSTSCLSVFVISFRHIVSCSYCKVKKYNFDMIHKVKNETYCCSLCCFNLQDGLKKTVPSTVNKEIAPKEEPQMPVEKHVQRKQDSIIKECHNCKRKLPTQFHMVMSDSSLRSFCSFPCATTFKNKHGYKVTEANTVVAPVTAATNVVAQQSSPVPEKTKIDAVSVAEMAKTREEKLKDAKSITTLLSILQKLEYPDVANKATSCRPPEVKPPETIEKEVNTDQTSDPKFIPVPYPIFVPQPMMTYTCKVPVPLIIPLPVPVPVFLPTTEKTTADIVKTMNNIQDLIPTDTLQAEMLMLAKGQAEEEKTDSPDAQSAQETVEMPEISLEEPNEILTFDDDQAQQELNTLNDIIVKFPCESEEYHHTGSSRKAKRSGSYDVPSKKRKTGYDDEENSVYILNSSYGIAAWVDWVKKKSTSMGPKLKSYLIDENIVNLSPQAINESLSMFVTELAHDRNYEIDTLFYILLGIQKDLFEKGSTVCIFLEEKFEKFTMCFDRVIENYMRRTFNADMLAFEMLGGSRVTEDILWQARQLGAHTPYVLLNTMFYFSTKAYKLATLQDHKDIAFSQVIKQWRRKSTSGEGSYTRTTLLKFFPRSGSSDCGTFSSESHAIEMLENKDDPLKCPVKLYQFYLSKCPLSVQNNQNLYYVYPESCCLPDSPVWFTTKAVNDDTLQRMLNRVLLVKEIQEALFH